MFPRNTIIAQVIKEVRETPENFEIIQLLDDLIHSIDETEYYDSEIPFWKSDTLYINTKAPKHMEKYFYIIETDFTYELSWLVNELYDVFIPDEEEIEKFSSTIGYLIETYLEKTETIFETIKTVAYMMHIWLHPDHIGEDRFVIHPNNLPKFSKEF